MDLIFATNNRHKLEEVRAAAGNIININSLIDVDIPEDFETLEENAEHKARFIYELAGKNCFADDTGLEVYALNNRPGVFSARYALLDGGELKGQDISSANIQKLLNELDGEEKRSARFRTVISLVIEGKYLKFEGIIEGDILLQPTGKMGFGYDPVFRPEGYDLSFAEMNLQKKNQISHRAIAIAKLCEHLHHLSR